ncbi:galactose-1-phosphate uridylyltransferase [uncultured Clostridium sp.]|nr:galactose-1-phosphate uridylyltransferase [uncultured Clostridium sp.]
MAYEVWPDVEKLLHYAIQYGLLDEQDRICAQNQMLDILQLPQPGEATQNCLEGEDDVSVLLGRIVADAAARGVCGDTYTERTLLDTRIMGVFCPRPSEVTARFYELWQSRNSRAATDWFYDFCRKIYYIRTAEVARSIAWTSPSDYGELQITINLSKPEKDPREVAKLKDLVSTSYPKCMLCKENVGYAGRLNHPARQTLRTIPLKLNGENWFFQYSPYVYYNEHCIVVCDEHRPMNVCAATFRRLFDFVGQFPHYFIGSNAGLPIVGGSILDHDHFQGGRHTFPMENAPAWARLRDAQYPGVRIEFIRWPMAAVRLTGPGRDQVTAIAERIAQAWEGYTDESIGVLAQTEGTPHNAITPIARKKGENWQLDIVFRSNLTSPEHPLGNFHPHEKLHHIKRENIGLIEVMGLFILPGRLQKELAAVQAVLCGAAIAPEAAQEGHPLHLHLDWLHELIARYGQNLSPEQAQEVIHKEVGQIGQEILADAGVFKDTPEGRAAQLRFAKACGLEVLD